MSGFMKYCIIVNIVGFISFLINNWLYSHTEDRQIDKFLTVISLFGAAPGIVLAILVFDRHAEKANMMSRVFVASVAVIEIILFLIVKGFIKSKITIAFWEFFAEHKVLLLYLLVINIIAIIVYGIDKVAAVEKRWRVRIVTLLGIAFIGGSIGALIAMYAFHHKTSKDYFTIGVPLILLMQVVVLFFLMNGQLWPLE